LPQLHVINKYQSVHIVATQTKRIWHRKWRPKAVRNCSDFVDSPWLPGSKTPVQRIRPLRLDTYDFAMRTYLFNSVGNPANKSTATDRNNERIKQVALLTYFQTNSPGPGRDINSLERMYEKSAFLLLDPLCGFERLVNIIRKDDFRAICAAGRNTHRVGAGNHHNFCTGANRLSSESRGYRMIPSADGRHTQIALLS
jgi:hypothetical protein